MRPNDKIKVLIVHSDPLIAAGLEATLGRMREFEMAVGGALRLPAGGCCNRRLRLGTADDCRGLLPQPACHDPHAQ